MIFMRDENVSPIFKKGEKGNSFNVFNDSFNDYMDTLYIASTMAYI